MLSGFDVARILMLLSKPCRFDGRVMREAHSLQSDGHEVTILEWARQEPEAPQNEVVDGVSVMRVFDAPDRSMTRRMIRWWKRGTHAACNWASDQAQGAVDVVHAHDLDTLPIAARLRRRGVARHVVFDAHERYGHMIRVEAGWLASAAAEALERRLLGHVDLVITCSDDFARHYRKRGKRVATVFNSFWRQDTTNVSFPAAASACYFGTLSHDRLWPQLAHAFAEAKGLKLVAAGKREGAFEALAAMDSPFVEFLGTLPHEEILPRTQASTLVLLPWDPRNPQYRVQIANKVYDAMAAGRPIVATKGTAPGAFVEQHGIGIAVPYEAQAFVEQATRLASDPGACKLMAEKGRALFEKTFHWEAQEDQLRSAYQTLLGGEAT